MKILTHPSDCETLAHVHAAAFEDAWDAGAIAGLLAQDGVFAVAAEEGFVLIRVVSGEAEILTLAVLPASRRRGVGRALVRAGAKKAVAMGAEKLFLEVNVGNFAANGLYASLGFLKVGVRAGYYRKASGVKEDALVLGADLPLLEPEKIEQPLVGCIKRDRSTP